MNRFDNLSMCLLSLVLLRRLLLLLFGRFLIYGGFIGEISGSFALLCSSFMRMKVLSRSLVGGSLGRKEMEELLRKGLLLLRGLSRRGRIGCRRR